MEFERKKRPSHSPSVEAAASPPVPRSNSVAERILTTADELFYKEGVRAVGIQRVIEEAGIAKASLYAHFASKDELVAACMERRGQESRAALIAAMDAAPNNPRAKLLALFDLQCKVASDPEFRGCPVQKTFAELQDPDHPVKHVAAAHRRWLIELIARLVKEANLESPDYVRATLLILHDGAIATTMVDKDPLAPRYARIAAQQIIDSHLPKPLDS